MEPTSVKKKIKITIFVILALISGGLGYLAAKAWSSSRSIFISGRNPISQLGSLLFDGKALAGESQGQINVLLLGIGGEGHDGPYLTDTMMVAEIKPETSEVSLISIPRDIITKIPGASGDYKINSAYAYGMQSYGQQVALNQARTVVENLTGLDIPYGVVVDFKGFTKAVNDVGGLDVEIDQTFTDNTYPNENNGYLPPVTFKKGVEHMDGSRALIYARSRHSTSDFDRAHRQQLILEAFNARVRQLNIFKDIGTFNSLFNDVAYNISTNLDAGQVKRLVQIIGQMSDVKIYSTVLDPNTGLLCSYLNVANGYHIKPCPGITADEIHQYIQESFARGHIKTEQPIIQLQNATGRTFLADAAGTQLTQLGIKYTVGSAGPLSSSKQTTVYDFTDVQKPDSLAVLLTTFSGVKGDQTAIKRPTSLPDFVVVLGSSYVPPNLGTIDQRPPVSTSTSTATSTTPTTTVPITTNPKTSTPTSTKSTIIKTK